MKFVCKIPEIKDDAPDMYCIDKKSKVNQKFIIDFMNQKCITTEQKDALRVVVKASREKNGKKFMTEVHNVFLDTFYTKLEAEKKKRPLFEDKF